MPEASVTQFTLEGTAPMLDTMLALLRGERVDEIVWTADVTYWMAGQVQAGKGDPAWDSEEGYLALHRDLGVMPYYFYGKFWAGEPRYDATVRTTSETRGLVTLRRIETPVGTLTEETTYLPESCCAGCTKHMVESSRDLDVLIHILEHRGLEPTNLDDYDERRELWRRYDGLPSLGLPRSPLSAFCYEWAGVENMAYLTLDAPEKVGQVLALMEEQEVPVLEAVCELAPPLVHFPDNLSSDNLTSYYDGRLAPTHRRRVEALHEVGTKCAVHLDGAVAGLLPKLVESGLDAIEALTPQPVGDLSPQQMVDVAGSDTVILWGGVPGALFAPPHTWDGMQRHVGETIACWRDRPFVLGVADQVPPDGDIEFCRKISRLVRDRT